MYGAILGDIIGSPFEFDRGDKTKDFELFTKGSQFTDDSVMTVAVAEGLLSVGPDAEPEAVREAVARSMREWGKKYPHAGYGGRFRHWLTDRKPKPYGSYGNGSAMRVSAAGWLYPSLERTREMARATAEVTHNHPEGIKGAEATASCIFMARHGASKEEIKDYVVQEFGYDLDRTLAQIRPHYYHVESCQETVPEAIIAFLESGDFEDAVRNAVSLGGDTDTLAAITGSIAEAFYDMPAILRAECRDRIPRDMNRVLEAFDDAVGMESSIDADEMYVANSAIEQGIFQIYEQDTKENWIFLLTMLCARMKQQGQVAVPMVVLSGDPFSFVDPYKIKAGDVITVDEALRLKKDTVKDNEGKVWLYCFTNTKEARKGNIPNVIINVSIEEMLENAKNFEDVEGIVINPFSTFVQLEKPFLELILKDYNENWREKA